MNKDAVITYSMGISILILCYFMVVFAAILGA